MAKRLYYWHWWLEYPKPSVLSEEEVPTPPAGNNYIYFFIDEYYIARYHRFGEEKQAWFDTAHEAYYFLSRGMLEGTLMYDSIELPTGEVVKAPYFGGDWARWESLSVNHLDKNHSRHVANEEGRK